MPTTDVAFDPLGARLDERVARTRQLREASNVLGSYHRATDLLAEALQNAADALDVRSAVDPAAPRSIVITFDAEARSITVADTGTGLSREALDIVFQPNITLKDGDLEVPSEAQRRGEKGIGLSFLLFACDSLRMRTCDGEQRYDVAVDGACSWVTGSDAPRYVASLKVAAADCHLGSRCYTELTLAKIDQAGRLDRDLFQMSVDELEWTLRTSTAVGNTAPLFAGLGVRQPAGVDVTLEFTPAPADLDEDPPRKARALQKITRKVPYRYATPEDLLARARQLKVIEQVEVHDLEDLERLSVRALRRKLSAGAVRYVAEYATSVGTPVPFYAFAMEGTRFAAILRDLGKHKKVTWVPPAWQGFWVATKDMPTGIRLPGGVLPTRAYEQRVFGLLQRDDLKLDMGRKTLAGGSVASFNAIIRSAWAQDLRWIVERFPRPERATSATRLELDRRVRAGQALDGLEGDLPLVKVPDRRATVAALFHELLAVSESPLPTLRPLVTEVFDSFDALVYVGEPNGSSPLHVVFAVDHADLLAMLDKSTIEADLIDLAVIWTLNSDDADAHRIAIARAPIDQTDGATHTLAFAGLGGRERALRTIVLDDLIGTMA